MKTFLDILNEAKIDSEYQKNWSMIDRDIFEKIVMADPRTLTDAEGIRVIGFVAKQLLLPKYKDGEKDFIDNLEDVTKAIAKYQISPGNYIKLNNFKSVSDFVAYMEDPENATVNNSINEVDPITEIYNKYYTDIKREDFDKIISLDPKTSDKSIGEVAKNLLLISFRKNENILQNENEIKDACDFYYKNKNKMPTEKQQLTSYKSVQEFIDYIKKGPESTLVAALKKDTTVDPKTQRMVKDDFRLVGSSLDYDILEPLSHRAAVAIGGGWNATNGMHWCTGWEPSSGGENDKYWNDYTANGGRLFCFMHKTRYRGTENRVVNWQIQVRNNQITEFLNGQDSADYPGANTTERFKNFLYAHLDILDAIKTKEPFTDIIVVQEAAAEVKFASEPLLVDRIEKCATLELGNVSKIIKEIIFDIPKIPAGICASFLALNSVTFKEGVKEIGSQAFMNCPTLKTLVFPESLEIIGKEAFQNCLELKGSIRIPDNVTEIRTRAFGQDKCKLKINKNRSKKIKFDNVDKDWVITHVQSITVN